MAESTPAGVLPSVTHTRSQAEPQPVDATKLNALLDGVKGRLTTDIYGNWLINGSKLSNDTRHGALGLVFQLVSELELTRAAIEKQSAAQTTQPASKTKKTEKTGNSIKNAVREVMEEQLSEPVKYLSTRCNHLEEELREAKIANEELTKKQSQDAHKMAILEQGLQIPGMRTEPSDDKPIDVRADYERAKSHSQEMNAIGAEIARLNAAHETLPTLNTIAGLEEHVKLMREHRVWLERFRTCHARYATTQEHHICLEKAEQLTKFREDIFWEKLGILNQT